jgi:hypothetical protein
MSLIPVVSSWSAKENGEGSEDSIGGGPASSVFRIVLAAQIMASKAYQATMF